jgi:dihydroorotate dehydrogenase (NAD+) catalytic subunit
MVTFRGGPVKIGHVPLRNHLLLAAGILGTTGASLARVLRAGAGGVITKSIGPVSLEGHPGPCVAVLEHGLLNAMGLPNPSQDFQEEILTLKDAPVVVSIFGGSPQEFHTVASWFSDIAVGFELNLSCPHAEGYGAAVGTDPDLVQAITREVSSLGIPTWVKLTPNVTDITEIGLAAEKGGASALVAINTVKAMRISTSLRRPILGNRFGGLSGPAIFPIALRCVYELYGVCSLPIIGCGGISSANDVVEMMMAGASAVEIGTAAYRDLHIFHALSEQLYAPDGIPAEEIVGCAHE